MAEEGQTPPTAPKQRAVLNLRNIELGSTVLIADESTAEVVENPMDGMWLICRYLTSPADPAKVGAIDEVFAQDILGILE